MNPLFPKIRPDELKMPAFSRACSGSVSILFGLMILSLLLIVGGSIDTARWLIARTETVGAIDAAVLAAGRSLQISGGDAGAAEAVAQRYYAENVSDRPPLARDTIGFKVTENRTAVSVEGAAFIETTLLKLAGINELPLLELSGSEFSKAVLGVEGNAQSSLEVALMLDLTGSMCDGGSISCTSSEKLNALKEAARDFINIVVWENQGTHSSRVALVPFSESVNIGMLTPAIMRAGPLYKKMTSVNGYSFWWRKTERCVAERFGANAATDAMPTGDDLLTPIYTATGSCRPGDLNAIVPLTSDKKRLNGRIDGLTASGATAAHLGTVWSWYTLSPNWAGILPAESRPQSYSLLKQRNSKGRPLLQKIAVLMTDGDFNTQYCETGQRDKDSEGNDGNKGNCTSANGRSADQTLALCAAMKAKGITVFTVGLQLQAGSASERTLNSCATSKDHDFLATNSSELKQSFRNIALRISDLQFSN
jgi:Flp pilus assembly protein TadG